MPTPTYEDEEEDLEFHGGKPSKKRGRPALFDTPEQMQLAIDDYFARCDPHTEIITDLEEDKDTHELVEVEKKYITKQQPYTMTGLSIALGFDSRTSLVDYKGRSDEFSNTIKKARQKVEESVETRMLSSQGVVAGVIFNAKNNFGWKDKSEVEINDPYQETRRKIGAFLDEPDDSGSDPVSDDSAATDAENPTEV